MIMENKLTILELWCEFKNQQGGTLHQTMREYKQLTMSDKDKFCSYLLDNSSDISDFQNMNWFFAERNRNSCLSDNEKMLESIYLYNVK